MLALIFTMRVLLNWSKHCSLTAQWRSSTPDLASSAEKTLASWSHCASAEHHPDGNPLPLKHQLLPKQNHSISLALADHRMPSTTVNKQQSLCLQGKEGSSFSMKPGASPFPLLASAGASEKSNVPSCFSETSRSCQPTC